MSGAANPGGAEGANGPAGAGGAPTTGPTGQSPFDIAKSVEGQNAADLKVRGPLADQMDDGVPNNGNCANFVSAVLEKWGQISQSEHNNSVAGLRSNLEKDPHFQQTSLKDAKPGDVVIMDTGDGSPNGHVVLFAGWKDGKPQFIGSNNVNPDGSQKVT